jgi:uncharacterized protein with PIN domain
MPSDECNVPLIKWDNLEARDRVNFMPNISENRFRICDQCRMVQDSLGAVSKT